MVSKDQRPRIFIERLENVPVANSADEALTVLSEILNAVEDEFSGVPYNPLLWKSDGRMYPPQEDSRRNVPGRPSVGRYRSAAHQTLIGKNGSIRIETLDGRVLLDKPGVDGSSAYEQDVQTGD